MFLRLIPANFVVLQLFLGVIILNGSEFCEGGKTSSFLRKSNDISVDMPLDSDVFQVPPGYNAPQQVCIFINFLFFWDLLIYLLIFSII